MTSKVELSFHSPIELHHISSIARGLILAGYPLERAEYSEPQEAVDPQLKAFPKFTLDEDYRSLAGILAEAYNQAQSGKGKERHANGLPFEDQPMQTISGMLDSDKGMAYQACKKIVEATNMQSLPAFEREILGAINYLAGMIIFNRNSAEQASK